MPSDETLNLLPIDGGFAIWIAAGLYGGMIWFGNRHLSQDAKDTLTLWLWGDYESTWSHHFCNLFDAVFGNRHLSWKCFFRSSVASMLTVALLYVLLTDILGVMGGRRIPGNLTLGHAVLFGAFVNIVPDYLSLYETRWVLKHFENIRSVIGQLAVLLADALFTGTIIWLYINGFLWVLDDEPSSVVEMLALFSPTSLFFYSTFLTSVWAWVYCLSTWIMRLFSRSALKHVLDTEKRPLAQISLIGASLIFVAAVVLTPILKTDNELQISKMDDLLCFLFSTDVCIHVGRLTTDENQALEYFEKACERGSFARCIGAAEAYFDGDLSKVIPLYRKACEGGGSVGCFNLGWMYQEGRGVAQDEAKAVALYEQACEGGNSLSCSNLGWMYQEGRGVAKDEAKAVTLYECHFSP